MGDVEDPRDARTKMRDAMMTRPVDWAPPARAHLFGLDTLTEEERAAELRRRAAYPDRYPRRERSR